MIIKKNRDEIESYLVDASNYKGKCDAVYIPENIEEIRDILFEANKNNIPVTIAGNGTGLTGARVPEEGIVISTEKLNRIIEINQQKKFAIVEPGILLSELQEKVLEKDMLYPPDPTERNCFIGGTIATNASGEKTFKYGPTRNYVMELELILANGDKLNLERNKNKADDDSLIMVTDSGKEISLNLPHYKMPSTKNASGYFIQNNMDAVDLFIGSEGTLAVIGRTKLRLVDKPENIISAVVFFPNEDDALGFIKEARKISYKNREANTSRLDALALEFMDRNSLNFLRNNYPNIPSNAGAGVWFEQESDSVNEDELLDKWVELINKFSGDEESVWFAVDEKEKKKIQEFRHALSWKVNEYISKNNFKKLGTDVAVPPESFDELYFFSQKITEESELDFIIYGHFGNSHMHLNMLPKSEAEYVTGKNIYKKICEKTIELKGTISAEHGIGKLKTEYLKMMYGDEVINGMKKIKSVLDPNWILGRGNIFK